MSKKKKEIISLSDLTEEQRASMKVKHYKLHLPANTTVDQIMFIQSIANSVVNNEPITIMHETATQFLLRMAYNYRNALWEFDEQDRWKDDDDKMLLKLSEQFKPMLEYMQEKLKLDISKRFKD